MTAKAHSDICRKLKVLTYTKEINNITKVCRYFGASIEPFNQWKRSYKVHKKWFNHNKTCPLHLKIRTINHIEGKQFI
ncbi:hypothetical protein [Emticicia sp. BO119]|uniref:hypothetical protein n=1 Tax=Emticicia sp. BO119 TaxID=2757768 RepID=UPI0015F0D14C|nr:hypothetical protein [Emticicia sp. BO119]MBA4850287.1 hypothetical protein [Emticicia sp. BO119]